MLWMAIKFFVVMTMVTGVLYPFAVTGIGYALFYHEAHGSLLTVGDRVVGSELIAQSFSQPRYFWPRPSATHYEAMPSGASQWGPTSVQLKQAVAERQRVDVGGNEMLFASASGLDPHISPASASVQLARVAAARELGPQQVANLTRLVSQFTEDRTLGILGEKRVNVLKLNLALDAQMEK